jgi:hypothetical protein
VKLLKSLPFALCLAITGPCLAHGLPEVPADYPSHNGVGECNRPMLRASLSDYNLTRLDVASVMRHLAEGDASLSAKTRSELIRFANSLDEMRKHLPDPNPDSDEFRNFDFHLGLTFSALVVYLNTTEDHLTERFASDRDDPNTELAQYLTRLDHAREAYTHHLAEANNGACQS